MLTFYNTLTRRKQNLTPLDVNNVRMYVCGPTVYDRPHLGNARSVVVYDVLYRLLCAEYGKEHVTYVRNITDVDDKINAAAAANSESIAALTARVEGWFFADIKALNCLEPNYQPRATAHIQQMITMIESLIKNGHAYESAGHVLFSVESYKDYGKLSGRKLDELIAGARVGVESYKKHPGDFVLWKPADAEDSAGGIFDSPWTKGRPGWHIECSAMSSEYLGANFDIHGGGADLMFPHHENEIAQSCGASSGSEFARMWIHNGFLTVNGEKMSKSLGNFITVRDLLDKNIPAEVIRLAFLMTKYNEPLDWSEKLLADSRKTLDSWYRKCENASVAGDAARYTAKDVMTNRSIAVFKDFAAALSDDMNSSKAIAVMHEAEGAELLAMANFLGLLTQSPQSWFQGNSADDSVIREKITARIAAKKAKNWPEADRIRKELAESGIILEDRTDGTTDWRKI